MAVRHKSWRVQAFEHAFGLAWLDLASGRFSVAELDGAETLQAELERLRPAELLLAESQELELAPLVRNGSVVRARAPWHFELATASRLLTDQLGALDLRGFGVDELPLALRAAGHCCNTCATRNDRRCRISGLCRSRSAQMRWRWTRPHAATSSSMPA